ncbi:hypothetical protein DASC09_062750 [Saccharomycopsis crataegensis]|uniref:Interferon-related developmental regulator N-terminal domain-containing protein n=1 Tax=Saccharomycopsis crataegensis TaxID=43959 RepID=A0AAV5QW47_9ASCO|nr:hypothetical protein DASC09_062750 [Saccharomycopsis crataegensis]
MPSFKSSTMDTLVCPTDEIYTFIPDKFHPTASSNKGLDTKSGDADSTTDKAPLSSNSVSDLIQPLVYSRTQISTESRENLLYHIFLHSSLNKSNSGEITETDIDVLLKCLKEQPFGTEGFFTFKSLVAICISYMEDYGSPIFSALSEFIKKNIKDVENVPATIRSYLIIGYFTMFLALNEGSHVSGIEEEIGYWLSNLDEASTNLTNDAEEAKVMVGIINGIGILVSLVNDFVERNEVIEDLIPSLIFYLSDESPRISIPAGALVAQCYQSYTFDDSHNDEDGDADEDVPYFDNDEIIDILAEKTKYSSKKISKEDKKQLHVAFRDMLKTVTNNVSQNARDDFKISEESEPLLAEIYLTRPYSKLQIRMKDWGFISRLDHMRWAFGSGLGSAVLANDSELLSMFRQKKTSSSSNAKFDVDDSISELPVKIKNLEVSTDQKKRDIAINKARFKKTQSQNEY